MNSFTYVSPDDPRVNLHAVTIADCKKTEQAANAAPHAKTQSVASRIWAWLKNLFSCCCPCLKGRVKVVAQSESNDKASSEAVVTLNPLLYPRNSDDKKPEDPVLRAGRERGVRVTKLAEEGSEQLDESAGQWLDSTIEATLKNMSNKKDRIAHLNEHLTAAREKLLIQQAKLDTCGPKKEKLKKNYEKFVNETNQRIATLKARIEKEESSQ